jgi:hypothetical protein
LQGLTDLAAASAQYSTGNRDTDRAIDIFNRTFGMVGVFHPHTPPGMLAQLKAKYAGTAQQPKASLAGVNAEDAAKLRHWFPGVYE